MMFAKLIEYQGDYEEAVKHHKETDVQIKRFPRAANIQGNNNNNMVTSCYWSIGIMVT